jgi:hypothetical protein
VIYEEDVIAAVAAYLTQNGYALVGKPRSVTEPGVDIVARRSGEPGWLLHVEAKGEGSSKQHTARYGDPFDPGQVTSCVSRPCFAALQVVSAGKARAAIAVPRTPLFESKVGSVLGVLGQVAIAVFWVDARGNVTVDSTWPI